MQYLRPSPTMTNGGSITAGATRQGYISSFKYKQPASEYLSSSLPALSLPIFHTGLRPTQKENGRDFSTQRAIPTFFRDAYWQ